MRLTRMCRKSALLLSGSLLISGLLATPALAQPEQTTDPADAAQTEEGSEPERSEGVGEMVVTAQRREQNLQDVPISVSAVSAERLQEAGVTQTSEIPSLVAGVTFNRVTTNPLMFIRGIGTQNAQTGEEGANPIYIDGFYNPSLAAGLISFNNIERIEVLKGPQGTLFGRNSMGGAVNVITREPSQDSHMEMSLGYGSYNTIEGTVYATTGIADNLAMDVALFAHNQGDGFGTNLFNGQDVNDRREYAGRLSFLFTPTERLKIRLAGDYTDSQSTLGLSIHPDPGAFAPVTQETYPGNFYDVRHNFQPRAFVRQAGVQLRADYDLDFARFVSMSSYRQVDALTDYDQDVSSFALVNATFTGDIETFTQEFQLLSPSTSTVQWIVGAFYLNSNALSVHNFTGAAFAAAGGRSIPIAEMATESIAPYAQATVTIGSSTDLTAGIRYTSDTKDLSYLNQLPNIGVSQLREDSNNFDAITYRLAAQHRFSEQFMLWASVSTGFKSGVYNPTSFTNPVAQPEDLTAYEIGFKTDLLDRHLRINGSFYHYDYSNIQLLQSIPGGSILVNAASAEINGIDVEIQARPTDRFFISAGGNYLIDHEYSSFPNAPASMPRPVPPGGNQNFIIDATGNRMIQSPTLTGFVNAAYTIPTRSGEVTLSGTYSYNSGFFWEADNRIRQEAYSLVNAQIAWQIDQQFRVRVWGNNLFDTEYAIYQKSSVVDGSAPGAPLTYGIGVDVTF
jgi:iron complex outermembrane receptor protein